jgi:hypothetical protein
MDVSSQRDAVMYMVHEVHTEGVSDGWVYKPDTLNDRDHLEDLSLDGRIILIWILIGVRA